MGEAIVEIDDALIHLSLPRHVVSLTRVRRRVFRCCHPGRLAPEACPAPHPEALGRDDEEEVEHHVAADFGSATIISSSTRAPGELSWLTQSVVLAGRQSPK